MKTNKAIGKQSILFEDPPYILSGSSVAGKKEGEGPLGSFFDQIEEDPMFGGKSWEDAESRLMKRAAELAIEKAGLKSEDIRFLVGGDLLGQLIATSFGISDLNIPMLGIYGACSTMGEAIAVGSMLVDGGFADKVLSITSSHFAGAEKQFRFPLGYGNQRPLSASWTVTGSGGVVLSKEKSSVKTKQSNPENGTIRVKGVTIGKIVDYGLKDSMNMGACMAPAAYNTISQNLKDLNVLPDYYDKIVTGDLGYVGKDILIDLLKQDGFDISGNHMDCGIQIFDKEVQDTHAGGSGCGCSAITLTGYIFPKLLRHEWTRVLFVPTGALLSQVSYNEGNTVPGIAHGVILESS
ncbi:stage V sporulation protein AD [Anaerocolumna sp. AGMB13025]|uniref:stage V sporulation protein AD n=1 Tax=Anaerocolumna sp. AGMB13025 TaxID=3039116 RepID=UPI00241BED99|nr:stage V sporulation protein AD [Anaerocolumna sp. AGMB13025]WFR58343.1 stage V sporulation protein AD [Anaerocolumna sp. AGMB13025]